jgi:hypothetical protein
MHLAPPLARSSFLSIMWDCLPWFNRSYWTTYSTTYYCTQIDCCLSFAYAETRLVELWRESTLEEPLRFEKRETGKGRVTVWRGWEIVNYFFHTLSNLLTRSVFTELTEFDRFRVFNPILHVIYMLTRKIIWFYKSTRDFNNIDLLSIFIYITTRNLANIIESTNIIFSSVDCGEFYR